MSNHDLDRRILAPGLELLSSTNTDTVVSSIRMTQPHYQNPPLPHLQLLSFNALLQAAVRVHNLDNQSHCFVCMGCTAQTRVEGPNHTLHPVQHTFGHCLA